MYANLSGCEWDSIEYKWHPQKDTQQCTPLYVQGSFIIVETTAKWQGEEKRENTNSTLFEMIKRLSGKKCSYCNI